MPEGNSKERTILNDLKRIFIGREATVPMYCNGEKSFIIEKMKHIGSAVMIAGNDTEWYNIDLCIIKQRSNDE